MRKKFYKKLKALSLVETVIYLALFGIVFTGIIDFSINVSQNFQAAEGLTQTEKTKIFIFEHFQDSFNSSLTIDTVNSIFNNDSGKLRITNKTGYLEYSILNNDLLFSVNGSANSSLTNSRVDVTRFFLEEVKVKNVTYGVRITMAVNFVKLNKTDNSIHLQDKIGHSSKKIEQSHRYFRILTLEN